MRRACQPVHRFAGRRIGGDDPRDRHPPRNAPVGLAAGPLRAAYGLAEMAVGTMQARRLLRRSKPAAVVGFGGYPSLPTMLAAASLGLPTLIHEQNAVLGRANRLLAPRVGRIATGFPDTAGLRPTDRARAVHTGNPVRPAILALGGAGYDPPGPDGPIELLVLGGSQGAHVLAEIMPAALAMLSSPLRQRLHVSQQARPEDLRRGRRRLCESRHCRRNRELLCRCPATDDARASCHLPAPAPRPSLNSAAIGRPALLIPYPYAADDHQTANARAFAAAGGGRVIAQAGLRAETLAADLETLLTDGPTLARMARERGRLWAA